MADNDRWNINRVGRAAQVTTLPGTIPQYGLAMDLGVNSTPYMSTDQYQSFMRDIATRSATQVLTNDPAYQEELERAQNFQAVGYDMPTEEFANVGGDEGFLDDLMTGVNLFKNATSNVVGAASTDVDKALRLVPVVGGYYQASGAEITEEPDPTYERYKLLGGILTQSDFEDFDESTRQQLIQRAEARKTGEKLLGIPGIKQAAEAIMTGYRGVQTPFIMVGNNNSRIPLAGAIDPMWFQRGAWAEAWKESQDQSLGNAVVNAFLEPYVGQDRIDEWKRESSLYQLTSLGVEAGAAWYLDAGVIGGKVVGGAARFRRAELPLNETGRAYRATTQALRNEPIRIGGLAGQTGRYRARRMQTRWGDLAEYAKTHTFTDFAGLKMFNRRDIDGQAAASALYWAYNKAPQSDVKLSEMVKSAEEGGLGLNYPDIPSLTQQLLHGDPKAYADLNALKAAAPEELGKFAPGAQTFIDAIEGTKTKVQSLTDEIEQLQKVEPNSPFHDWSIHTEIDQRVRDVEEATDVLRKYEDYDKFWLRNMGEGTASVSMVNPRRAFFMDNQFGRTHLIQKVTRPIWIKKANTVEMHDIDSGATSLRRQFEQMNHLFGYQNPEAVEQSLLRWTGARTAHERYEVARDVEEVHLIDAAAQKFGVDPGTIRVVYDKIIAEQNKRLEGIRRGAGSVYSTAPNATQRIASGDDGIKLLREDPETGMVELELMESGGRRTTVVVPKEALNPKGPIDPTQTPNYYQPIDTRRFYLELKRNRELIRDMHFSGIRTAKAATAEIVDSIGTKFNALWKPAVLFRFGWPQRVLMDEGMRGLAVLGIPAFTKYYGSDYARAANNATIKTAQAARNTLNAIIRDPIVSWRTGRKTMNIGPGPIAQAQRRSMDPVAYDEQVLNTPRVPESFTPVLDNARYESIARIVGEWDDYHRQSDKFKAWDREWYKMSKAPADNVVRANYYDEVDPEPTPIQKRAFEQQQREEPQRPGLHPMMRLRLGHDPFFSPDPPSAVVYDPIPAPYRTKRGAETSIMRQEKSGYAVPLPHTKINEAATERELMAWYSQNRELLGSSGYRIMQLPDGGYAVARLFQNRQRRKAEAMAEFVEAGEVHNLRTGKSHPLKDWNDLSPTLEQAYHKFGSEAEVTRVEGDAPYGGPKRLESGRTVFHGTEPELPEDLLPREQVPVAQGRMAGEGFYTTTRQDIAEGYGPNLYTIRGAKDGKKYRIFDMDKSPSQAEIKRLRRWAREQDGRQGDSDLYGPAPMDPGVVYTPSSSPLGGLLRMLDRFEDPDQRYQFAFTDRGDGEPLTWLDLMAALEMQGPEAQRLLTRYLEERHGAGALTHGGGRITGSGDHRVHIWLKPEELEVKPLYEKTGRYYPFMDWLGSPVSREVPIPENRVIRTGIRNPRFATLHQVHARRQQADTPELRQEERAIMDELGLEYADNVPEGKPNVNLGQSWYVMTDPGKFERAYAEAQAIQRQMDTDAARNGELRAQEADVQNIGAEIDFDLDLDSVHNRVLRGVLKRRESGKGWIKTKDAQGNDVAYPSAWEGHKGEMMRSLVSSQGAMEMLSDGHGAATSLFRRQATGHRAYQPPVMDAAARTKGTNENRKAIEYFNQWGDLLNGQIAHSPIWSKMLEGWSDEKIVNWLERTPEGAQVRRELKHEYRDTELWVNEHRAKLDYYLPSKKLQRVLGKGKRLDMSQLRKEIPDEDLPTVFGPDVDFMTKLEGGGQVLSWMADRVWHALGTVPIDVLSRHPFARSMYDLKMKSLIRTTDSEWLDDATIRRYETQARKYAREQVRQTLWDLLDQTNFTDALRFMAPFWGAQSEAIVKWTKIVSDRPETVARAFALNNAVYQNFQTVDEDGNPVTRGRFDYTPTDRVIMRIPSVMRKTPLGKGLETIGTIGVPIGSANVVLQGEMPLLPGPGPMLTIPADLFLKYTSDTYGVEYSENDLYRWLFPIGRPKGGNIRRILDQVAPAWGRRVMELQEGDGGIAYANLYTTVAREMALENQRKGLADPTPQEIERAAKWLWGVRIFAGLVSPVQTQFRPKHQYVLDAAHKYQQNFGLDWFDRFVNDFGLEMVRYATSSTNAPVGTPPTLQGLEDWSQNKELVQKYKHWGEAIISPDAHTDDFSSDAYYTQLELNVGPGDDTPLRESQSTSERFAKADARAGWYEFRKVDAILDVQLQERGLHSLQQVGAEDLMEIKRNFIADLTSRNPSWREEYNSFNNDIYSRVAELEQWAYRPEFDNRPDIQGVRQYLMIRDEVAAALDNYAATTGGSRSLEAQENGALRDWFYSQVGQIAQANPAFAEFYSRYLSQDTLAQGSGGF